MMTPEAAKKIKFVFVKSIDLNKNLAPCDVFTLEDLRKDVPFFSADQAIWFEKNINRELSVIYEDLSLRDNEKAKKEITDHYANRV